MLYFDSIGVSEGTDVNETSTSKGCHICHYCQYVCNRCYDLLMMFMNLSNIAIFKIKNTEYHCITVVYLFIYLFFPV